MKKCKSGNELVDFWMQQNTVGESDLKSSVLQIISEVRQSGDHALRYFTKQFDAVEREKIRVGLDEITNALQATDEELIAVLREASENIRYYHSKQKPKDWSEEQSSGIVIGQKYTPVESVGVYVPGGRAVYPSTILMNVIPAQVAGVERIAIVTPPSENGAVSDVVLACAALLGVSEVYAIGGVQAIAALAYGTSSVDPVAKITGPGNKYVNEAKLQVYGKVGIDMPAGPTELAVLADDSAKMIYVAADIIAQAEHDPDAKTTIVTTSKKLFDSIEKEIDRLIEKEINKDTIRNAISDNASILYVKTLVEGAAVMDRIAPEHLQVMTKNPSAVAEKVTNASAIFLGNYTPNVIGDYWAGANHTLPTSGGAKFSSPLGVLDFMKFSSTTYYPRQELLNAGSKVVKIAESELLYAHASSIKARLQDEES